MIRSKPFITVFIAACLGLSAPLQAKLYRWVDADGNVQYSDKVPAQDKNQARTELNKQGVAIGHEAAAKTPQEIAREAELQEMRQAQQRLIEAQQAKDRVLLRTFRSEEDLLLARDGKVASIEAQIQVTRSNIRRHKVRLAEMQKSAAETELQGKKLSANLRKDIESTRMQLKDSYALIIKKEQEKQLIRSKAEDDLARFRALNHSKPQTASQPSAQPVATGLVDTVASCSDKLDCAKAWERTEAYVRQNASTRVQMLSELIIMTAAPEKDEDISITASRIEQANGQGAEIFMDLQCKPTPRGIEFCSSAAVETVRSGFRQAISGE